jgi:hypothetical protein
MESSGEESLRSEKVPTEDSKSNEADEDSIQLGEEGKEFTMYSLIQYKGHNSKLNFFYGVHFRKYFVSLPAFYLIIWLMQSPKNFEKTFILKI